MYSLPIGYTVYHLRRVRARYFGVKVFGDRDVISVRTKSTDAF